MMFYIWCQSYFCRPWRNGFVVSNLDMKDYPLGICFRSCTGRMYAQILSNDNHLLWFDDSRCQNTSTRADFELWSLGFCALTRLWKSAWKREMPKNTGPPGFSSKPFYGRCHMYQHRFEFLLVARTWCWRCWGLLMFADKISRILVLKCIIPDLRQAVVMNLFGRLT